MADKDEYKYVRLGNSRDVKKYSEESGLYVNESIRKSELFLENKDQQVTLIEDTRKVIHTFLEKLNKLVKIQLDSHWD